MIYLIGVLILIIYYTFCYYAEKAYDKICIDFLDYLFETGDKEEVDKMSKLIGGK